MPLAEWPEEAKRYAIDDAVTTLKVYEEQDVIAGVAAIPEGAIGPDGKERAATGATCSEIPNAAEQHRAAWALYLMSIWGVRTDGPMVATLKTKLVAEYAEFTEKLRPSGFLRFAPERALKSGPRKGLVIPAEVTKDTKAIKARVEGAFAAKGEEVPRTDASEKFPEGQVSTSKKTLLASGDAELKTLAERGAIAKLVETYVPILESGTRVPINARYNVLVETGRTSCSKPNCFSGDTEPLTSTGWQRFDAYDGATVAQFDLDGSIEFVKPYEFIRLFNSEPLLTLKNQHIDLAVTPDHRCSFAAQKEWAFQNDARVLLYGGLETT